MGPGAALGSGGCLRAPSPRPSHPSVCWAACGVVQVAETSGPGPADLSNIVWMYHSHTSEPLHVPLSTLPRLHPAALPCTWPAPRLHLPCNWPAPPCPCTASELLPAPAPPCRRGGRCLCGPGGRAGDWAQGLAQGRPHSSGCGQVSRAGRRAGAAWSCTTATPVPCPMHSPLAPCMLPWLAAPCPAPYHSRLPECAPACLPACPPSGRWCCCSWCRTRCTRCMPTSTPRRWASPASRVSRRAGAPRSGPHLAAKRRPDDGKRWALRPARPPGCMPVRGSAGAAERALGAPGQPPHGRQTYAGSHSRAAAPLAVQPGSLSRRRRTTRRRPPTSSWRCRRSSCSSRRPAPRPPPRPPTRPRPRAGAWRGCVAGCWRRRRRRRGTRSPC